MERNVYHKSVFLFFLILFSIAILLVGRLLAPFFATIILGIVATGIFSPVFRLFSKKLSPKLSSCLTCLIIFFAVFIPVVLFIGIISKEALGLYLMAKDAVFSNQMEDLLRDTQIIEKINFLLSSVGFEKKISWDQFLTPVSEIGKFIGLSLVDQAKFITSNILTLVFYFCLMLIVVFYMFIDLDRFIKYIYDLSPLCDEHNEKLFEKFMDMSGAVLVGNGLGGVIQGFVGGMIFLFIGLDSPFLWGVIMCLLAFLPIVGVGAIMLPASFFLMLNNRLSAGIFLIISYAVLSWGIEYIFKPKVVGDRVSIHPLIVFFAIIGGLKVYGILGIIYGPLIATLFLTLADIYFSSFQFMVEPERKVCKDK